MGVLSNDLIMNEFISIQDCFEIELADWANQYNRPIVESMLKYVYNELESRYGGSDFTKTDFFEIIHDDLPELITEYLYYRGFITSYKKTSMMEQTHRRAPYFGLPEAPTFVMYLETSADITTDCSYIRTSISNIIWEKRWAGVDPVVYDRFIRYMNNHWDHRLPYSKNPDPWNVLNIMVTNPKLFEKYGNTL